MRLSLDPLYLKAVSMNELFDTQYQSKPPLIDGLLYPGTYIFAGSPKLGKSILMAQLARFVAEHADTKLIIIDTLQKVRKVGGDNYSYANDYHIHLIFSERKLLPEPYIKIVTRSVFYNETGKRVRTKKEITKENGQIRKGCTVIKKGEIYESHLFSVKDDKFKSEPFLREVKSVYTEFINCHISDPEQYLKVLIRTVFICRLRKSTRTIPKSQRLKQTTLQGRNGTGQRIWRCCLVFLKQRF